MSAGFWKRVTASEPDDTVYVFERATEVRYYDGQEFLVIPGRCAGAIYLLGYYVELILKVAYCKLVGIRPVDPVLSVIAADADVAPATVRHHRISDLYSMVSTERSVRSLAVDPIIEGEIQSLALLTASHWKEELRYRSIHATNSEADEADEASTWFMMHREDLWR